MRVRWEQQARECRNESTDWSSLGARILQVATTAAAMHLAERIRVSPQAGVVASPLDSDAGSAKPAVE
jgi:hypothetical protein